MITVISATNRIGSNTRRVAEFAHAAFLEIGAADTQFLSLEDLPADTFSAQMYDGSQQSAAFQALQNKFIIAANKFYIVAPEYNGSYPGVFKMFLDVCSMREVGATFGGGKKAALLGVAAGRAGNLRGIEQLAGVLNHLKIAVMPNLQPLASIGGLINAEGKVSDEATQKIIKAQVSQFLNF